jgi:hypothetical protein
MSRGSKSFFLMHFLNVDLRESPPRRLRLNLQHLHQILGCSANSLGRCPKIRRLRYFDLRYSSFECNPVAIQPLSCSMAVFRSLGIWLIEAGAVVLVHSQWYLLLPLTPNRLVLMAGKHKRIAFPSVAVFIWGIP